MQDSDLIKLLRKSPERGLEILMNQYMGLVYAVVNGKLSGVCRAEDIEECVSDTFVDFYHSIDRVDLTKGTVKAFLCAIAKHKAINVSLAADKTRGQIPLDSGEVANTLSDGFSVEEAYLSEERRQTLMEAVAALGEPDREIIVRKFFLCEPSKAIAKRLDMTVSAVDTRTHRALGKLRKRLGGILP